MNDNEKTNIFFDSYGKILLLSLTAYTHIWIRRYVSVLVLHIIIAQERIRRNHCVYSIWL